MDDILAKLRANGASGTAALEMAQKLIGNVIAKQDEPKYRKIKTSNAKLQAALFSVPGGRELMLACGFEEDSGGEELILPSSASLVTLRLRLLAIEEALKPAPSPPARAAAPAAPSAPAPHATPTAAAAAAPTAPPSAPAAPQPTAMEVDDDEDEEAMLQQALLLSQQQSGGDAAGPVPNGGGGGDEDEDEDMLQQALALSRENNGVRSAAPAAPPAAAELGAQQAKLQERVKQIFAELTAAGKSPNEAAAEAFKQASSEMAAASAKESGTSLPPLTDPASLLEKAGFEARVKALFAAHTAAGLSPNEAAAKAMQQAQNEQLQATQAARHERSAAEGAKGGGAGGGGAGGGGGGEGEETPGLERQGSEAVEKFERWEEIERVATAQVDAIHEMYRTEGITFIDPSFAPTDRALYMSTDSATTWKCRACGARNPLPPPPDAQGLIQLMHDPNAAQKMIRCGKCQSESHALEVALRPTGWARPAELRDDVTLQFSTVPWMLVRDEPRPDDIRQGHVGNCWFVCAMSALAEEPSNIRRILVTKEFNHAGVYQVKLCRAGEWHCVVIDDVLPVTALSCLAYLKAARRSLWGPLIEKAAAKLNGSYEALNGGTFSEAFGMLTGMPVQNIRLAKFKPPERPPNAGADELASYERRLAKWQRKGYDLDELYAQLFSFKASGFVIGCSTFFATEKEIAEARATGIQVPHAYCLLELASVDDEPLVKLRNPNGHAGWKGDWSRGSSKWTYESRTQLKTDTEDSGVFWMSWADFTKLFAEVCVCRLKPDAIEARQGGWLPSIFGAGMAMEVEVYAHTQLELTVHQEAHSNRGESSFATLKDLGCAVLRLGANDPFAIAGESEDAPSGGGEGGDTAEEPVTLVAYGERVPHSSVSLDTTLQCDGYTSRYLVVPLCFGHLGSPEPRKFASALLSTQVLSMQSVELSPRHLASAMIQIAVAHGEKMALLGHPQLGDMLNLYTLEEDGGWSIVAENLSPYRIRIEVDASEHTVGYTSSRGALFCQDVIPSRHRQLVMCLSVDMSQKAHGLSLRFGGSALDLNEHVPSGAGHIPAFDHLGKLAPLHEPMPMPPPALGGAMPAAAPPPPPAAPPQLDIMAALGALGQPPGGTPR